MITGWDIDFRAIEETVYLDVEWGFNELVREREQGSVRCVDGKSVRRVTKDSHERLGWYRLV